ncbi:hypothetical protein [Hydrococcus rivularis]|uniref:hypothetical protein n=1 Tax=Hydrococcus rivularis TaxID=1616834 RepID=UPI000AF8B0CB|nr:hypothetical protein [Hydrococcus rivularis]
MKRQTILKSLTALWQELISQIGDLYQLLFPKTALNLQEVPVETKSLTHKGFLER